MPPPRPYGMWPSFCEFKPPSPEVVAAAERKYLALTSSAAAGRRQTITPVRASSAAAAATRPRGPTTRSLCALDDVVPPSVLIQRPLLAMRNDAADGDTDDVDRPQGVGRGAAATTTAVVGRTRSSSERTIGGPSFESPDDSRTRAATTLAETLQLLPAADDAIPLSVTDDGDRVAFWDLFDSELERAVSFVRRSGHRPLSGASGSDDTHPATRSVRALDSIGHSTTHSGHGHAPRRDRRSSSVASTGSILSSMGRDRVVARDPREPSQISRRVRRDLALARSVDAHLRGLAEELGVRESAAAWGYRQVGGGSSGPGDPTARAGSPKANGRPTDPPRGVESSFARGQRPPAVEQQHPSTAVAIDEARSIALAAAIYAAYDAVLQRSPPASNDGVMLAGGSGVDQSQHQQLPWSAIALDASDGRVAAGWTEPPLSIPLLRKHNCMVSAEAPSTVLLCHAVDPTAALASLVGLQSLLLRA